MGFRGWGFGDGGDDGGVRLRLRFGESFGVIWGIVNIRFTIYDVEACIYGT
jgi:hypothetical protein